MPPRFSVGRMLPALALSWALGCRPSPEPPPYPGGQEPDVTALLAAASPNISALTVSRAKVRIGPHRGNLMYLAEAPARFRGSVEIAGNEVVTLSVHDEGYQLRYKLDAIPTGYYAGPPSACAVEALLGVGLDAERLVAVVLGGAPLIDDFKIVEQGWDKKRGKERVLVQSPRYRQELLFDHHDGRWRFSGATLWQAGDGRRLWTVEHVEWHRPGGVELPRETRLSRPGKRRDEVVTIQVKQVDLDPPWAVEPKPEAPAGGADTGDGGDSSRDETGGDGGGDTDGGDDPWGEDDGGGWENAEPGDTPGDAKPDPAAEPTPTPEPEKEPAPTPKPAAETKPSAPPLHRVWKLKPDGLKQRGDLCRRG